MNRANVAFAIALVCSFGALGCARNDVRAAIARQPEKRLSSYAYDLSKPVAERIVDAPDFLLDYLNKMDGVDTYRPHAMTEAERALFSECYGALPSKIRDAFDKHVIGIYVIDGFKGGGMGDWVWRDKDASGGFESILVLNADVFKATLPEWISFRDASPFEGATGLRSDCGEGLSGLHHALAHEAAHIYDYHAGFTPFVETHLVELTGRRGSEEFSKGVWKDYGTPEASFDFPKRGELRFYGFGTPLPGATARDSYAKLAATPFASLYGSMSWAEDFAETFAWAHLAKAYGVRYRIVDAEGRAVFDPEGNQATLARRAAIGRLFD